MVEISVVTNVHNAEATIGEALSSLMDQDFPRERYEVVVVDDGSSDRTAEVASGFAVRVVRLPENRGRAAAKNAGVREARGRIVAFMDGDCRATPRWLSELHRAFEEDPEAGGVGGPIEAVELENSYEMYGQMGQNPIYAHNPVMAPGGRVRGYLRKTFGRGAPPLEDGQPVESIMGGNAAYRKDVLERAGGYDESFRRGVDWELNLRLRKAGARLVYRSGPSVVHRHRSSFRSFFRGVYEYGRAYAHIARKHPEVGLLPYPFPPLLLVLLPVGFLTGLPWLFLLVPLVYLLRALPNTLRVSRELGAPRVILTFPAIDLLREAVYDAGLLAGALHAGRSPGGR